MLSHIHQADLVSSLITGAFTATGCFIAFFIYLYIQPRHLSPLRHLPGPPVGNIVLGQFGNIARSQGAELEIEWTEKYGDAGHVRILWPFGYELVAFLRPSALRKILVEEPYSYPKPSFVASALGLAAGYGLLTVEGNMHKNMRKTMNPAFSLTNIIAQFPTYYGSIYSLVDMFNQQIDQNTGSKETVIDCADWCSRALLDIICQTAFGYRTDALANTNNELGTAYHQLISLQNGRNFGSLLALLQIPGAPWVLDRLSDASAWSSSTGLPGQLGVLFKFLNAMHRIKLVSREILNRQLSDEDQAGPEAPKSIIGIIDKTRQDEGGTITTEKDMVSQVLTFLGAGHETTASGVSWMLWMLATHPDVQAKLAEECSTLLNADPIPAYSEVKQLAYLDAVVNETMRFMPPVPRTMRQAAKSDYIDGVFIPKGTLLAIANRAVNTDKRVWGNDALTFRPERWFDLPEKYDKTFSMLTFIAGAHQCIGRTMSYLEMKAVVCVLVAHFEFAPVSKDQKPRMDSAITMKPTGGLPLIVTRRVKHR